MTQHLTKIVKYLRQLSPDKMITLYG